MPDAILIIEDNEDNLELMGYLLKAFHHSIFIARNGAEGIAAARSQSPALIICDIQLPDMDGYAIARVLKADPALHSVPLVAVTALAMVGDRDKILAAGFDGYISKPIDPESFVPRLESFLRPPVQSSTFEVQSSKFAPSAPPPVQSSTFEVQSSKFASFPPACALILVVDDLPVNLSLKRSVLEPVGYSVLTADSMKQALEIARHSGPDLILSDLNMADGNGYDFIRAVKLDPRLKDIPFIFVTSTNCDDESRAKGLALGAARFLFRPLEPQVLLAEIAACLPPQESPRIWQQS